MLRQTKSSSISMTQS